MSRGDARVLPGLLFALGAALSGFTILQGVGPHDEGLMLQAGARIASGQWPYRDFWMNYPPGQPLVLAALQELFGASLLAWRVVRTLTDAGVGVLVFLLVRDRAPRWVALLGWLAAAGALAWPTGPGPNPPALLLCLGALLAAARKRPLLAGALAGLAFGFRFELGLAAILGVLVLATPASRRRCAACAAAGALIPIVSFLAVGPGALWQDTFGFYGIQALQRLPFPLTYHGSFKPDKLLELYAPAILVAGVAVWAAGVVRRRDRLQLALAPILLVSLAYLLGRTDEFHLVPLAAVLPLALGSLVPHGNLTSTGVTALLALALIALHGVDRRAEALLHPFAGAAVPGPAGDGVQTTPADATALRGLEQALGTLTRPGEAIFVANPHHDLVHAGDPLLYVVLGHPNATRYDVMQPGLLTTAPVQREIVGELAHTRVVIRWLDPRASLVEANDAGRSSGVHILDRYLAANFTPRARYGYYALLTRTAR
ncbi:MAG: hypothetical protein M3Z27_00885 [Actinomycetota bacterium]|nr:hypothetical protein [Actinomycetota bacterium]